MKTTTSGSACGQNYLAKNEADSQAASQVTPDELFLLLERCQADMLRQVVECFRYAILNRGEESHHAISCLWRDTSQFKELCDQLQRLSPRERQTLWERWEKSSLAEIWASESLRESENEQSSTGGKP